MIISTDNFGNKINFVKVLFCKSLKERSLWQHRQEDLRKTSADLSKVELWELMPQCVLDDTRKIVMLHYK